MIGLLQRVRQASVVVDGETIAQIGVGLLVLVGIERGDDASHAEKLLRKLLDYRIFADTQGRMNRSLSDIQGGLLLVPQFTLAANTEKGLRPGFDRAAPPDLARPLFAGMVARAQSCHPQVQSGAFGADMQVALVNDGPVTFWLRCE